MLTVYSPDHVLHNPKSELNGGELVRPFERPERVQYVLDKIDQVGLGKIIPPEEFGIEFIHRIHDVEYIEFLQTCWAEWKAAGHRGEAIPSSLPVRGMSQRRPNSIDGRMGFYAMAMETTIVEGSWAAAEASANVALTAQAQLSQGAGSVFALCRPPGHHAASNLYGGYCFVNNAAVSTQAMLDQGATRIAILDVDFHHGNGTQAIFYDRSDVLFLSLHGHPEDTFPHFLGYKDETGVSTGEGYNHNFPLRPNTTYETWSEALLEACGIIGEYAPDALVVSLGVDTYEGDPISFFKLKKDDFKRYGAVIARLGLPTMFAMEGGYAMEEIGANTVNVLTGFEDS
ncbi:MAG: histone deacetylase family protein [Porticoccus sp.]|nr:histone deacetylase family protein [Porticoccus sp.]